MRWMLVVMASFVVGCDDTNSDGAARCEGCGGRGDMEDTGTIEVSDTDTYDDGTAVEGVVYERDGCPGVGEPGAPLIPWPSVVQLLVCSQDVCELEPERLVWLTEGSATRVYLVGCADAAEFRLSWVASL